MSCTAFIAVTISGKSDARKIRKIAERSPTPNQRMAKGIQASGERLRKKLTAGSSAALAAAACPRKSPRGTLNTTASTNPMLTRKSDAMRSVQSLPVTISSRKPSRTSVGEGKADLGKS
jgi:hypothetical protein